ncbi:MAG: ABC transporter ATP-binding protein [Alphaproteobacteria bacterium]|nr:ABC transporter ATP-binding protein [Alphaproteobacteria bacterium]
MTAPLLELDGLTVAVTVAGRSVTVVDGLAFALGTGETLGLVGESGSGKTMTALAIMRLLPPAARIAGGRVQLAGEDLAALDEGAMRRRRGRRVAMIFQEPITALDPVMTVGNQIAEVLVAHDGLTRRQARAEAMALLDAVGIALPAARLDEYPHRLSGGMRQRIGIAAAIAARPALLIADEPTTALDVTVQAEIVDLLLELQARLGMAILVISHNLGLISELADRIAVIYAGRLVEIGAATDVLAAPAHPYTRGLIAATPRIGGPRGRLATIPGMVPGFAESAVGCRFAPRCTLAFDRCRSEVPALAAAAGGRHAACHLVAAEVGP